MLVNATRGGSEGGDVEVYDPRTGQPLEFTYEAAASDPHFSTLVKLVKKAGLAETLSGKANVGPVPDRTGPQRCVGIHETPAA